MGRATQPIALSVKAKSIGIIACQSNYLMEMKII
jgi:hypothetical protein